MAYEADPPPKSGEIPEWAFLELQRIEDKLQDVEGIETRFGIVEHELGWKDLIGDVSPKSTGSGRPTLEAFTNNVRWFSYAANDKGDIVFHIPHDYAPGTDLFVHVHWSHNGTSISGSFDMRLHVTYAKSHLQDIYPADKEPHVLLSGLNLTNSPQYHTRIDEIQLSTPGGSATQLDTDLIEPDGLILMHYNIDVVPSISGGTSPRPFIFAIDIHYQTDRRATVGKLPDFNTIEVS